ncbi:serine protease 23-like [Stylophora pistillata]|uniref:serine protease 23-like n=1 Tax=Stylophora pistillata TaxID=50429 RepID=UPI000C03A3D0|nr:serine protease 23-like [Stylophora pistillata]
MKAIFVMLLMLKAVSVKTLPEFEPGEKQDSEGHHADDNTDDITLVYRPETSRENLIKLFNLTAQDLDLSYETILPRGLSTITLKRTSGKFGDKKVLDVPQFTVYERGNRENTRHSGGTNQKPQAKRVIIPPDDRKQLSSSNKAQKSPHSAACKVSCKGSCRWSCSGTLIGSHHVLTSAHCIDGEDIATLQVGFLERNGRLQWYDVIRASIPLRWKINKKTDDYTVLKLEGRANRRSYVSVVSTPLPKNSLISITGFPGDKPPSSLWISKCRAILVTSGQIWNNCDVVRGSSGSGVLKKESSRGTSRTVVVGVLSGEKSVRINGRVRRINVAVHLTGSRLSQINEWINK